MKAWGGAVFPVVVNMVAGPRADWYATVEGASKARGHETRRSDFWIAPKACAQCATRKRNSIKAQLPLAELSVPDASTRNGDCPVHSWRADFRSRSCAWVPSALGLSRLAPHLFARRSAVSTTPFLHLSPHLSSQRAPMDFPASADMASVPSHDKKHARIKCRSDPLTGTIAGSRRRARCTLPCYRELTKA
jgi:hypothetical protein